MNQNQINCPVCAHSYDMQINDQNPPSSVKLFHAPFVLDSGIFGNYALLPYRWNETGTRLLPGLGSSHSHLQ